MPHIRRPARLLPSLCLLAGLLFTGAAAPRPAPARLAAAAAPANYLVTAYGDAAANFSNDLDFTLCKTETNGGPCTLRAAIMNANRHPGGGIVHLPSGSYTLTVAPAGANDDNTGDLNIDGTVTVAGDGADSTVIDAALLDNHFTIENTGVFTLTGVTLRNGTDTAGFGGALYNNGRLYLGYSVLRGNHADQGGALNNALTVAILDHVTIADNHGSFGGGILSFGTLTMTNSTVDHNTAGEAGGIDNSGSMAIFNSTISNNSSQYTGGGIESAGGISLYQTTVAGNLADSDATGDASLSDGGGGLKSGGSPAHLYDSLLADNYISSTASECSGSQIVSHDYNFLENACSVTGQTGHNQSGEDSLLGELGDNGGATQTRPLLAASRALDQIPANPGGPCGGPGAPAPAPDQRGVTRPVNGLCDMGAFEGALPTPRLLRNLVRNGDAEGGAASLLGATVGAPGWSVTAGQFTVAAYDQAGFPDRQDDAGTSQPGYNLFAGGKAATSSGFQVILLSPISTTIDANGVTYAFSADLGGTASEADAAQISLQYYDQGLSPLGAPIVLGPVTAAQRGFQTTLLPTGHAGSVPAGARIAIVTLTETRSGSGYNNGYADNISLILTPRGLQFLPLLGR